MENWDFILNLCDVTMTFDSGNVCKEWEEIVYKEENEKHFIYTEIFIQRFIFVDVTEQAALASKKDSDLYGSCYLSTRSHDRQRFKETVLWEYKVGDRFCVAWVSLIVTYVVLNDCF